MTRTRQIGALTVVGLLFIALACLWAVSFVTLRAREELQTSMLAVLTSNQGAIDRWRQDTQNNMVTLASSNGVRVQASILTGPGINAGGATETRRILSNLLASAVMQPGNLGYLLIDPRNIVVAASSDEVIGLRSALASQPGAVDELLAGNTVLTLPLRYQAPDQPEQVIVVAGAPVTNSQGRVLAGLLFYLDPNQGYGNLLQFRNDSGGETYTFNAEGYMLSPSLASQDLTGYGLLPANTSSVLHLRIADPGTQLSPDAQQLRNSGDWPLTEMAATATQGQDGSNLVGYRNYLGKTVLGAWLWDPAGYGIATEIEQSSAYAGIRSTYTTIFVLGGLSGVALLAVVFTSGLAERRENRIRKRYEMTIEGGLDAVITFDENDTILSWNPQAENIFGYKKEEVIGKPMLRKLFNLVSQPVFQEQLDRVKESDDLETRQRGEMTMLHKNGSFVPVDLFLVPLKIAGEKGFSAVIRDLTDIVEARLRLRVAHDELTRSYDATLRGWSAALDLRDNETEGHTLRVTDGTMRLASALGLGEEEILNLYRGALLHDIGKIGIPDEILRKPGPLNDSEWDVMRQHTVFAYNMLKDIPYLETALEIPLYHHEKWDGSGYPRGLKADEIPFAARLFCIIDVWDALSSDRPYRKGWSQEKVLDYIIEQSGTHFDPQIVKVFAEIDWSSLRAGKPDPESEAVHE